MIKFWPSRLRPREGVCGGEKIFGTALQQQARCLRLSKRFFHLRIYFACFTAYTVRTYSIAGTVYVFNGLISGVYILESIYTALLQRALIAVGCISLG